MDTRTCPRCKRDVDAGEMWEYEGGRLLCEACLAGAPMPQDYPTVRDGGRWRAAPTFWSALDAYIAGAA